MIFFLQLYSKLIPKLSTFEGGISPNYQRYLTQIVIAQIEDLYEGCGKISRL